MPSKYAADFETTTISPAKVWCWGVANVQTPDIVETGRSIDEFIDWCKTAGNPTIYFHNEKFDGTFIIDYLLRSGYKWKKEKGKCSENEFTTIIDDFGKFYSIEIYWKRKGHKVTKCTIYDSLKIIPMSVDSAAKNFGLAISKLHIDYDRHNTPCPIIAEEWEYLRHDVSIMAQVLKIAFSYNLTKMTIAGCCLRDYKDTITDRQFVHLFPVPPFEMDMAMRAAYKGGWTYANPENSGFDVGDGLVFDVNSLYPSQMCDRPLPFGVPVWFRGKYQQDDDRPLFIQKLVCEFWLKENYLPCIQIKGMPMFNSTEWLKDSHGLRVELCLASPDLELFLEHYHTDKITWLGGWKFWESRKLFKDWVDKWAQTKIKADKEGNRALRQIAKLFMNNLYGRFAINPQRRAKYPVWNAEEEKVEYQIIKTKCTYADGTPQLNPDGTQKETDIELTKPVYIPVGIFITAWARYTTISAAQKVHMESLMKTGKSRFCYADTDSIHITGTEIPDGLDVDPYRLGAWKCESRFAHAKFLQAKRYVECICEKAKYPRKSESLDREVEQQEILKHLVCRLRRPGKVYRGMLKVTCAGLPHNAHKFVTFDNFEYGAEYPGKLIPKIVPGGTILEETTYKLNRKGEKRESRKAKGHTDSPGRTAGKAGRHERSISGNV